MNYCIKTNWKSHYPEITISEFR